MFRVKYSVTLSLSPSLWIWITSSQIRSWFPLKVPMVLLVSWVLSISKLLSPHPSAQMTFKVAGHRCIFWCLEAQQMNSGWFSLALLSLCLYRENLNLAEIGLDHLKGRHTLWARVVVHGLAERGYFSVYEHSRAAELARMSLSSALYFHTWSLFGRDLSVLYYEVWDGSFQWENVLQDGKIFPSVQFS